MAVRYFRELEQATWDLTEAPGVRRYKYICDAESDLASILTNSSVSETAYCAAEDTMWRRGTSAWIEIVSGGDVVGPSVAVDNRFVAFDSTTGKLIKDSGSSASTFAAASHSHASSDVTGLATELAKRSTGRAYAYGNSYCIS